MRPQVENAELNFMTDANRPKLDFIAFPRTHEGNRLTYAKGCKRERERGVD